MDCQHFSKEIGNRPIILFGAGRNAEKVLCDPQFDRYLAQVVFFVDNDTKKQFTEITCHSHSFPVYPPLWMRNVPDPVILLTPADCAPLKKQVYHILGEQVICFSWSERRVHYTLEQLFTRTKKNNARFILLNTPDHSNLGDHAIAMAERSFLSSQFKNEIVEIGTALCHSCVGALPNYVNSDDVIAITGGGFMGSLWPRDNRVIFDVIRQFPDNNIIVFPQSIYFELDEQGQQALEYAKEACRAHSHLLLCARDMISHDRMREYFPNCRHMLLPDMVLSMKLDSQNTRAGIGIALREDKEGALTNSERERIATIACAIAGEAAKPLSNMHSLVGEICHQESETLVFSKIEEYSSLRCVITDRLHGMVFSAITGTPCVVIDNSYHKNRAVFETWMRELSHVSFVDDLSSEALTKLLSAKIAIGPIVAEFSTMSAHFQTLARYISSLGGIFTYD